MQQLALESGSLEPGPNSSPLCYNSIKHMISKASAPTSPLLCMLQIHNGFLYLSIISSGFLYLSIV